MNEPMFVCPECENGEHLVGYARAIVRGAVNPRTGKVKEAWSVDFTDADVFDESVSCDVHPTARIESSPVSDSDRSGGRE